MKKIKMADHPRLWKNFATAMGADEKEIETVKIRLVYKRYD